MNAPFALIAAAMLVATTYSPLGPTAPDEIAPQCRTDGEMARPASTAPAAIGTISHASSQSAPNKQGRRLP
jgi:hypothetical protein